MVAPNFKEPEASTYTPITSHEVKQNEPVK